MTLYLSVSKARNRFKRLLGHANHQIITALIGLHAIETGKVTAKPEEFDTVWAPHDPVASATRSRALILEMALVRCVDALDTYIRLSIRQPALVQSTKLRTDIARCGYSVFGKFQKIEQFVACNDELLSSLVTLIIAWRNRQVHTDADDEIGRDCRNIICGNVSEAKIRFRGLDANEMLDRYENNKSPRFKEVASFVKITQDYVNFVEEFLFSQLDEQKYLRELVWNGLSERATVGKNRQRGRKYYSEKVWGKSIASKRQAVERFLQRSGLSRTRPENVNRYVVFDASMIEALASRSPREVLEWADPARFEGNS